MLHINQNLKSFKRIDTYWSLSAKIAHDQNWIVSETWQREKDVRGIYKCPCLDISKNDIRAPEWQTTPQVDQQDRDPMGCPPPGEFDTRRSLDLYRHIYSV